MKPKHTPGPWIVKTYANEPSLDIEIRDSREFPESFFVADICPKIWGGGGKAPAAYSEYTKERLYANANLLAAAPELLSACREAVRQLKATGADPEDYEEITAAISKAEGGGVMNDKIRCSAMVYDGGFRSYNCSHPAVMEHKGKHYCGKHDPVKKAARHAARYKIFEDKWNRTQAIYKSDAIMHRAYPLLINALKVCLKELLAAYNSETEGMTAAKAALKSADGK